MAWSKEKFSGGTTVYRRTLGACRISVAPGHAFFWARGAPYAYAILCPSQKNAIRGKARTLKAAQKAAERRALKEK